MAKKFSIFRGPQKWLYITLSVTLILGCVIVFIAVRTYTLKNNDRQAFEKTNSLINGLYDKVAEVAGKPLYVDKTEYCYRRSSVEFAPKQLYCRIQQVGYWESDDKGADAAAHVIAERFASDTNVTFTNRRNASDKGGLLYSLPGQPISSLANIQCTGGIYFPEVQTQWEALPKRSFKPNENILSFSFDCLREVQEALYPMRDV